MADTVEPTAPPALPERLVALLIDHLDPGVSPQDLTPQTTFESLGADSLFLMGLVVAADREFGVLLTGENIHLSAASTLGDVARVLDRAA